MTDIPFELLMKIQHGTMNYRYRGVSMLKNPFDLALYALLLSAPPETLSEIGTHADGPHLAEKVAAFVRLGEELGADVAFQKYYSFGHEPPAIFASQDITSPSHPDHDEFQAILREPAMRSPRVVEVFLSQLETRTA